MKLGYNTNGFAHHRLEDAIEILAELGYRSVALTVDHHALSPNSPDLIQQTQDLGTLLQRLGLRSVIETGARFLLDPRRKHHPTLLDPDQDARERRFSFLATCVELARILGSDAVSFWSGTAPPGESELAIWDRLVGACRELCLLAERAQVRLAFEPEPGMFIDTMDRFEELFERVGDPRFGLTLDIGHLYCMNETPVAPHVSRWQAVLWNVHIEDMRRGVHDHLMFGDGEVDFEEASAALRAIRYQGGVHVELSRHSHDAVETARRSRAFLGSFLNDSPEAMECHSLP